MYMPFQVIFGSNGSIKEVSVVLPNVYVTIYSYQLFACYICTSCCYMKVEIGNGQEMAQSERSFHSKNPGVGKTKLTHRY